MKNLNSGEPPNSHETVGSCRNLKFLSRLLVQLALVFLFLSNTAWATVRQISVTYKGVLSSVYRPEVTVLLDKFKNKLPEENPFLDIGKSTLIDDESQAGHDAESLKAVGATIDQIMPEFIATLEGAYPGATFAFLGRDSMLLSDVVDAFYLSRGEAVG